MKKIKENYVELDLLENSRLKKILISRLCKEDFHFRYSESNHTDYPEKGRPRYKDYEDYGDHTDHTDYHNDKLGRHQDKWTPTGRSFGPPSDNCYSEHWDNHDHNDQHIDKGS